MNFITILIIAIVIGLFWGFLKSQNNSKLEAERGEKFKNATKNMQDFIESTSVIGVKNLYKFAVDHEHKKILYLLGSTKSIIPFDKIMSVFINEDNTTIASKSSLRTIGGAVVGGAIAGGAGTIVGGLSGNTNIKKKVSKVQVIIKMRDLQHPSLTINCFDCKTMTIEGKEIKPESLEGFVYKQGLTDAQRIADLIGVIIDEVDKEQKSQTSSSLIASSSTIADLEKLTELKEKGILTEEEFNEQKKKILAGNVNVSSTLAENAKSQIIMDDISPAVRDAIINGQKLSAIKIYMDETGVGLAEAKKFIEHYM